MTGKIDVRHFSSVTPAGLYELMANYPTKENDCELVIGVVSAVGTEKEQVFELLTERLESAGYSVHLVKITTEVIPLFEAIDTSRMREFDRIHALVTAGNRAREKSYTRAKTEGSYGVPGRSRED